jgi:hypothetical protein
MPEVTIQELRAIFSGDASSFENATKKAEGGLEKFMRSELRATRAIHNISQSLLSGGDAASIFARSFEGLEHTFKIGLAAGIGIAVGAALVERLNEAAKAGKEMQASLTEALSVKPAQAGQSVAELDGKVKAAEANMEKFRKKADEIEEGGKSLFQRGFDFVRPNSASSSQGKLKAAEAGFDASEEEESQAMEARADKEEKLVELEKVRATLGKEAAAQMELSIKQAETLASKDVAANNRLMILIKEKQALEQEAFDKAVETAGMKEDFEQQLISIQKSGSDVEVKSAQAAVDYWQKKLELAGKNKDLIREAALEEDKAANKLRDVTHAKELESASLSSQTEIANLQGSADQRHLAALEIERKHLEWVRENAKPDERPKADLAVAKNAEESRQEAQRLAEQNSQSQRQWVSAAQGFGPSEELNTARANLQITRELIDEKEREGILDETAKANLTAQVSQEERSVKEKDVSLRMTEAENALEEAKIALTHDGKTAETQKHNVTLAEIAAVQTEIQLQDSLNTELSKGLQIKLQSLNADLHAQELAAFRTPAAAWYKQQAANRAEERGNQRAERNFQRNDGLRDVQRDLNGNVIGGRDPVTGERVNRTPSDPLDARSSSQDSFDQQFKDRSRDSDATRAWEQQFKTKKDQDNAVKAAKVKSAKPKGKQSDADKIVNKLEELKNKLDDLVLK